MHYNAQQVFFLTNSHPFGFFLCVVSIHYDSSAHSRRRSGIGISDDDDDFVRWRIEEKRVRREGCVLHLSPVHFLFVWRPDREHPAHRLIRGQALPLAKCCVIFCAFFVANIRLLCLGVVFFLLVCCSFLLHLVFQRASGAGGHCNCINRTAAIKKLQNFTFVRSWGV